MLLEISSIHNRRIFASSVIAIKSHGKFQQNEIYSKFKYKLKLLACNKKQLKFKQMKIKVENLKTTSQNFMKTIFEQQC